MCKHEVLYFKPKRLIPPYSADLKGESYEVHMYLNISIKFNSKYNQNTYYYLYKQS